MKVLWRGAVDDGEPVGPAEVHSCFPVLTRLGDGTLVLACRLGPKKDSADGKLRVRASRDGGRTWKRATPDFAGPIRGVPAECRLGGLVEAPDGTRLFTYGWVERRDPSLPFFHPKTEGLLPIFLARARAARGSWDFRPEGDIPVAPKIQAAITGHALVLPSGRVLQSFETNKAYDDAGPWFHEACAVASEDGGRTWGPPVVVAADPTGRFYYWDQRHAALPGGRIFACFWTYDRATQKDVAIHAAWSEDGGRTWTPPFSTGREGQVATPIPLADGRVAVTWVRRHAPAGIRVALTRDGRAWTDETEVYALKVKDAGRNEGEESTGDYLQTMELWNFGLPCGLQLPNGNLLLAHYAPSGGGTRIETLEVSL
jgi:hypothetical protein